MTASVIDGKVEGPLINDQPGTTQPNIEQILRRITVFGSPVVLATGLLFYFGWVRAKTEGHRLGYDVSVLPLSTTDYLLKSINLVFIPGVVLLLFGMIIEVWHVRFVSGALGRGDTSSLLKLGRWSGRVWLVCLPVAALLLVLAPSIAGYLLPFLLTLTLAGRYYGQWLGDRLGQDRATTRTASARILLLTPALFWDTERVARAAGEAYAAAIKSDPSSLIAVQVISDRNLGWQAPGLRLTVRDAGSPGARLFVYDGLRLIDHAGQAYILVTDGWDDSSGRAILLQRTDGIELEFSR
jgi:hypothetical protein